MLPLPFLRLARVVARVHEDLSSLRVAVHAVVADLVVELLRADTILEVLVALHAVAVKDSLSQWKTVEN